MNEYVIWDDVEEGFFESRISGETYFTKSIDNAKRFDSVVNAIEESRLMEYPTILKLEE